MTNQCIEMEVKFAVVKSRAFGYKSIDQEVTGEKKFGKNES